MSFFVNTGIFNSNQIMKNSNDSFLSAVGGCFVFSVIFAVLMPLTWLYTIFSYGFVSLKLWNWFILPLFPNMPSLNILTAMGLTSVFGWFNSRQFYKLKYKGEKIEQNLDTTIFIILPWITLIFAWVLHLLINSYWNEYLKTLVN